MTEVENSSSYCNVWREAEKPFSQRTKMTGRNGSSFFRKYHLKDEERVRLISEANASGGTVNPLKSRLGAYWGSVEALILLGINEYHSLKKIRDKMQEIMEKIPKKHKLESGKIVDTDAWTEFYGKSSRDGASKPKDGHGRIEQNFKVLQRLPKPGKEENNAYGSKLAQFGMCIDIEYREISSGIVLPFIRLNTLHEAWTDLDTYPTIIPLYINPNARKKSKISISSSQKGQSSTEPQKRTNKKAKGQESDSIEVVQVTSVEITSSSGSEEHIISEDSGEKSIYIPPDDFDQQVREYEDSSISSQTKIA